VQVHGYEKMRAAVVDLQLGLADRVHVMRSLHSIHRPGHPPTPTPTPTAGNAASGKAPIIKSEAIVTCNALCYISSKCIDQLEALATSTSQMV
jgi:hypothetical protein